MLANIVQYVCDIVTTHRHTYTNTLTPFLLSAVSGGGAPAAYVLSSRLAMHLPRKACTLSPADTL